MSVGVLFHKSKETKEQGRFRPPSSFAPHLVSKLQGFNSKQKQTTHKLIVSSFPYRQAMSL